MSQFQAFKLDSRILENLALKGYTTPTPIQSQAIPTLLEGHDLLGIAQTGTGKTASFALPLINRLILSPLKVNRGEIRSLILAPTRELAAQINENILAYAKNCKLKTAVIFGGVSQGTQVQRLREGLDILVATPGRLVDLVNQRHVSFKSLEVFILDEADRMLDMGFIHDVKKITKLLPTKRQTLLFSATMPREIEQLAQTMLKNPIKVEITPESSTVEKIEQKLNFVAKPNKKFLLKSIIDESETQSVLVFTRTKRGADKVVKELGAFNIVALAIHGNKSQGARESAIARFKSRNVKVLVATDIAARGIDVPSVSHVINYDMPTDPEAYVHRIGRTARAGRDGVAISFCDDSEKSNLMAIQKLIKYKIPVVTNHAFSTTAAQDKEKTTKAPGTPSGGQKRSKRFRFRKRR